MRALVAGVLYCGKRKKSFTRLHTHCRWSINGRKNQNKEEIGKLIEFVLATTACRSVLVRPSARSSDCACVCVCVREEHHVAAALQANSLLSVI